MPAQRWREEEAANDVAWGRRVAIKVNNYAGWYSRACTLVLSFPHKIVYKGVLAVRATFGPRVTYKTKQQDHGILSISRASLIKPYKHCNTWCVGGTICIPPRLGVWGLQSNS